MDEIRGKVFIDTSFFSKVSELKLEQLKLSTAGVGIVGEVNVRPHQALSISLNDASFAINKTTNACIRGEVVNVNTIDEFKGMDKRVLLDSWAKEAINCNNSIEDIGFIGVLMFADLKKYKFYYWCCQPTYHPKYEMKEIELNDGETYNWEYTGRQFIKIDEDTILMFEFSDGISSNLGNLIKYIGRGFKLVVKRPFGDVQNYLIKINDLESPLTGWERTLNGKLGPKVIDLGSLINPLELSKQARDLNLKLMKWRLAPKLKLDLIKSEKCLLLGSGTLGTYIGRLLMAWGVDKVTFVDSGKVSFSNPVRQPLFEFEDCLNGGEFKSIAAAKNLKKVYPNGEIEGVILEVPMIGHPITNKTKDNYEQLKELIKSHDIIYLLMDSSESRWLPTGLCKGLGKIVINVALGFDSYVVMRHGQSSEDNLGCYYCSNVNAPGDSSIDKTLDQMCTVTRPGLAPISAGVAVELMVDLVQTEECERGDSESLPQQIRGYLNGYKQGKFHNVKFENCVGCSKPILEAVKTWDGLQKLLKGDDGGVERLSGLSDLLLGLEEDFDEEEGIL